MFNISEILEHSNDVFLKQFLLIVARLQFSDQSNTANIEFIFSDLGSVRK